MTNLTPGVSIFIPTYNDKRDLSACLESIRQLEYPKEKIEIVIWDNGSEDYTSKMVQERYTEMTKEGWLNLSLIEHHRNVGSYIPYNLAVSHLSPKTLYILGLDADVEFAPDLLSNMAAPAQSDQVAVVGARSVYFDKPELTSHGAGFVNRWTARYSENDAKEQIECDYVIGCCWLLNRKILEELGCFDPDYYINHWEVDYCLRARDKGFRIIYEPKAIAKHKIDPKGTSNLERIYYLYRNKLLLIKRNPTFFNSPLTLSLCFGLSLCSILSSFTQARKISDLTNAIVGLLHGFVDKSGERKKDCG